jgi:hypothetical protein
MVPSWHETSCILFVVLAQHRMLPLITRQKDKWIVKGTTKERKCINHATAPDLEPVFSPSFAFALPQRQILQAAEHH